MHQLSLSLFRGRHFDRAIIILCIRWYITYKLSYRNLVEMMAERDVDISHTTILRWVQRYVPEFVKCWNRHARSVGLSWRVDETYIRVRGRWTYLYRAVDKQGQTVDFLLSEHRDITAAKEFFTRATKQHGPPQRITVDGYPATHTAINELKAMKVLPHETEVRTSKYLNNLIEQDHRRVKQCIYSMHGFKRFSNAAIVISGIELTHRIRKKAVRYFEDRPERSARLTDLGSSIGRLSKCCKKLRRGLPCYLHQSHFKKLDAILSWFSP